MSDDINKIDEIFRIHDEIESQEIKNEDDELAPKAPRGTLLKKKLVKDVSGALKAVDSMLIEESVPETENFTGDEPSERDYHPIRQSHEYRSGCLGGIMYFVFVVCISVVFACVAWMAVSDMLALNKENFTTVVTLPAEIFSSETVDAYDEQGNKTGTERVTHADIEYVSSALKEAGLIEYKWLFELFSKVSNADEKVDPGEYELKSSYDYRALVQKMRSGSSATVTVDVTIPEGFTMRQIFLRLEENKVCSYDALLEAAETYKYNYSFLDEVATEGAARLEGYLFPDTYQFYVGMQASSAINKLLENFYYRYDTDLLSQTAAKGMSIQNVIIVASLIEREAANDTERPIIAGVIYNRLNTGMQLGIDASILYAYPEHEGAPTADMLASESPYNTRNHTGLTPTPICNPGLASIKAALNPEANNYYYYALDTATNEHKFFTNEGEFNSFVATQNYG